MPVHENESDATSVTIQQGQDSSSPRPDSLNAPAETVLCLDVALTFWAALKLSTNLGGVGGGGGTRQKPYSIFCLGELGELTSAKSLATSRQRMDVLSWGLAERFKHVLLNLEREEQAL
ncbi:hypothetical protein CRV24_005852 [Beauveria bassiana]|nr:hypothetical protein CRV24_005852 [Beauveria bassiana]